MPLKLTSSMLWTFILVGLELPYAASAAVEWAGQGRFRLLVRVDPVDIGKRTSDEMPAEIVIDLSARLRELGAKEKANIASLQVIQYDPDSGKPIHYDCYAYGHSRFDRPFRWYDAAVPYDFPE